VPTDQLNPADCAPDSSSVSVLSILRVTVKRKKLLWTVALAIVLLGLAVALWMPDRYTATVVILPPQQSPSTASTMMAQLGNLGAMASAAGGLSIKNPNDQQVALLKSRTVEDSMVARFHLQELYRRKYLSTARKRWESVTTIDNGIKDGLIRLSVTDRDPRRAADLANGWVDEYRRFTATLAITEAAQRRLFFERQLSAARDDLTHAEEDMKQTEQRTGVIEIEGQARAMIASAAMLRAQVAAKQVELRAMREFAANQNPDLQRAQTELTGLEGQLASMDAASDRTAGDLAAPKGNVTQAGLDYTRALREVKYREAIQDLLTRQYEGARVDEARQGALVQVVDAAVIPDRPSSLYRPLVALGALVIALPLGLLAALAAEFAAILRGYRSRAGSWAVALENAFMGAAR
jgi:tyrosine-protein kinase Etk/Wzc